jgi:hypothetical protein
MERYCGQGALTSDEAQSSKFKAQEKLQAVGVVGWALSLIILLSFEL